MINFVNPESGSTLADSQGPSHCGLSKVAGQFNWRDLKHDEFGVPVLSATEIESIAEQVLEKYSPLALAKPKPTPVIEIIAQLRAAKGLTSVITDLGSRGDSKILGKVNFSENTLYLDESLVHEREIQQRFTAGHELGHWIIHRRNFRNWKFGGSRSEWLEIEGTRISKEPARTPREWIEWQANQFSAALIMPRSTIMQALVEAQLSIRISKNRGHIWLSDTPQSKQDYETLVNLIAKTYAVSRKSAEISLRSLDMINEDSSYKLRQQNASEVLSNMNLNSKKSNRGPSSNQSY